MGSRLGVIHDPRSDWRKLQVLPSRSALVSLIDWRLPVDPDDGAVPALAAQLLARAVTRVGPVLFLEWPVPAGRTEQWQDLGDREVRVLKPRLSDRLRGYRNVGLVYTKRAEVAEGMFNSGASWSQRQQIACIYAAGSPPPDISYSRLTTRSGRLAALRGAALILPGVNGATAELVCVSEDTKRQLLAALASECSAARLPLVEEKERDITVRIR